MILKSDTMEVASDHVHLFVGFPPRLSTSEVVGKLKAISAKVLFEEFPELERELYGESFGRTATSPERLATR